MRFLVEVNLPTEATNKRVVDGSLMKSMPGIMQDLKPEAVYFGISHGKRAMFMILNVEKAENIPEMIEPLWINLNAEVRFTPVMNAEEFKRAEEGIKRAVKKRM